MHLSGQGYKAILALNKRLSTKKVKLEKVVNDSDHEELDVDSAEPDSHTRDVEDEGKTPFSLFYII